MQNMGYYDGTKLLSLNDKNGQKPEIYICTSNRSAGKTTFFGRYLVNRFLKYGEKFGVQYRFKNELKNVHDKFFRDIGALFFQNYSMCSKKLCGGSLYVLYLVNNKNEGAPPVECGYAWALNSADQIKKNSHLLSDIKRYIMDEFQSENNNYCTNEIEKFISIHTSIARGRGSQCRYVPVFMLSNPVSLLNPYYCAFNISASLKHDTKFLRGDGFVLEQSKNESAKAAQENSVFNRALSNVEKYNAYNAQGAYLNDNTAFVEKISGASSYLCTIYYMGKSYGLREMKNIGVIYVNKSTDNRTQLKIALTTDDLKPNYIMINENRYLINVLRYFFNRGCFRFADLECKQMVFKLLSY